VTTSSALLAAHRDLWAELSRHPFVTAAADGTLAAIADPRSMGLAAVR